MILFAADRHYDVHPGKVLFQAIQDDYEIDFYEDDWSCFAQAGLKDRYDLLMLNMIAGTCDVPPPGPATEPNVRAYVEAGGDLLLLHGSSAAFWPWDWWRPLTGFRWVRANDPDGVPQSTHPKRPYTVRVAKTRHSLCAKLQEVSLPEDEIYIDLEQTCPTLTLMQTTTEEGTFPQCYLCTTPYGGSVVGYLPGHRPDAVGDPSMVANVRRLIDYLLSTSGD